MILYVNDLTGRVVMKFVNKDWSEDSTKNVAEYECNKHTL
jgi:hypothetical protein